MSAFYFFGRQGSKLRMLMRTRRRVVEEEVTQVISHDNSIEAWIDQKPERMNNEQDRLNSFDCDDSIAQRLARAGFYFSGIGVTECFSCRLWKSMSFWQSSHFWQKGRDPEMVHRQESPDCEFLNGQSDNVPIRNENPNTNQFTNKSLSLPNKSQDPTSGLGSVVKTDQHLNVNENSTTDKLTKKNVDSTSRRNHEGDVIKRTNQFSTNLRPSSPHTREPDSSLTTYMQQRLPSISAPSNMRIRNPDGIVKVSVPIFFCYFAVLGNKTGIVAFVTNFFFFYL